MAWTTPKTWNAGELVTATAFNTYLRDNQEVLLHNVLAAATHFPAAAYSTTSTTYVPIDAANLSVTVRTNGGRCLILAGPLLITPGATSQAVVTLLVNGTPGVVGYWVTPSTTQPFPLFVLARYAPGTPGSVTFTLAWRSTSGAAITLGAGSSLALAVLED